MLLSEIVTIWILYYLDAPTWAKVFEIIAIGATLIRCGYTIAGNMDDD